MIPEGALCKEHPEVSAMGACIRCGHFVCADCNRVSIKGTMCADCYVRFPYWAHRQTPSGLSVAAVTINGFGAFYVSIFARSALVLAIMISTGTIMALQARSTALTGEGNPSSLQVCKVALTLSAIGAVAVLVMVLW